MAAAPAVAGVSLTGYLQLIEMQYTPGNHAIVLGMLGSLLDAPQLEAVAGELYAFAAAWVAAAVRLGLTDHLTAQWVLRRVRPVLADAAERAIACDVDGIVSCTPLPDVMSMRHEEAELRLFAS